MADAPAPVLVYDRVAANRHATRRLLALFTLLILPFVAGLIPLLAPVIAFGVLLPALGEAAFHRIHSTFEGSLLMLATTLALTLFVVLVAGLAVAWLELAQATRLVLRLTRARPVTHEDEPELCRTVENLSLAAGLPAPRVHVIKARAPNAFATGLDPEHSAVVVTRGLLQLLDRRGLQGVIAHELSHIGNQDTRLSTVLAAVLAVLRTPLAMLSRTGLTRNPLVVRGCLVLSGVMAVLAALSMLGVLAEIAVALWFFSAELRDTLAAATRATVLQMALVGTLFFYGPLVLASPFYLLFGAQLCGRRVSGAVSRQREFLADGDAVLLTRDPEGLAIALVKVAAASGLQTDLPRAAAHLFVVEPLLPEAGWWDRGVATHPSIEERVTLLGQMGSGIPAEVLEAAREAGARFRDAVTDQGSAPGDATRSAVSAPAARPAGGHVLAPPPPQSPKAVGGADRLESAVAPGAVSYLRLAQGPVALLEGPEATAPPCRRLLAGTSLALLAVDGEFLRVRTPDGAIGYIPRSTPVIWGSG